MNHSRLVCGRCSRPVSQGQCSACRGLRDGLHVADTAAAWLLALALVLLAILAFAARANVG